MKSAMLKHAKTTFKVPTHLNTFCNMPNLRIAHCHGKAKKKWYSKKLFEVVHVWRAEREAADKQKVMPPRDKEDALRSRERAQQTASDGRTERPPKNNSLRCGARASDGGDERLSSLSLRRAL